MSDQQITCSDCGGAFVFTQSEQQFYASKGLSGPKRCKTCRLARKASADGGGGGEARGPKPGGRGGFRDAGPPARGGGGWGRMGGGGAPRFSNDRRPQGPRTNAPDRPRGDTFAPKADRARFEVRDAPQPGSFRPRREGKPGKPPRPASPAHESAAATPKVSKKKAERPKFDVTCITCGTAAQVPFKPIEGRDVFCQPCYRARRPPTEVALPSAPTEVAADAD